MAKHTPWKEIEQGAQAWRSSKFKRMLWDKLCVAEATGTITMEELKELEHLSLLRTSYVTYNIHQGREKLYLEECKRLDRQNAEVEELLRRVKEAALNTCTYCDKAIRKGEATVIDPAGERMHLYCAARDADGRDLERP